MASRLTPVQRRGRHVSFDIDAQAATKDTYPAATKASFHKSFAGYNPNYRETASSSAHTCNWRCHWDKFLHWLYAILRKAWSHPILLIFGLSAFSAIVWSNVESENLEYFREFSPSLDVYLSSAPSNGNKAQNVVTISVGELIAPLHHLDLLVELSNRTTVLRSTYLEVNATWQKYLINVRDSTLDIGSADRKKLNINISSFFLAMNTNQKLLKGLEADTKSSSRVLKRRMEFLARILNQTQHLGSGRGNQVPFEGYKQFWDRIYKETIGPEIRSLKGQLYRYRKDWYDLRETGKSLESTIGSVYMPATLGEPTASNPSSWFGSSRESIKPLDYELHAQAFLEADNFPGEGVDMTGKCIFALETVEKNLQRAVQKLGTPDSQGLVLWLEKHSSSKTQVIAVEEELKRHAKKWATLKVS